MDIGTSIAFMSVCQCLIISFQPSVAFHIETTHLTYTSNQMTGFCMECNTVLKQEWVKLFDVNAKSRSQNEHIKMDQLADFVQSINRVTIATLVESIQTSSIYKNFTRSFWCSSKLYKRVNDFFFVVVFPLVVFIYTYTSLLNVSHRLSILGIVSKFCF